MDAEVRIDSRVLRLTRHALERYGERVAPALDGELLVRHVREVLSLAEVKLAKPLWVMNDDVFDYWLLVGDGIALPVRDRAIVTCLTRSEPGDAERARRRERRRRTDPDGYRRKVRKPHGGLARDERRRRRDLLTD